MIITEMMMSMTMRFTSESSDSMDVSLAPNWTIGRTTA
jgi:hypothetical protein